MDDADVVWGAVDTPADEVGDYQVPALIEPPPSECVAPLGYDHGTFFYYSEATRQVTKLLPPQHTRAELCALASQKYWHGTYRHHVGENGALSWPSVAAELMDECRRKGVYDRDRVRGRGVWMDEGRIVAHLGNRLVVDGIASPLILPNSNRIYEAGRPLLPDTGTLPAPLSVHEAVWLAKICRMLRWENRAAGRMLAGWLAIAPICGALQWRPSIWITGGAGAGKSWVANNIVRHVLRSASIFVALTTTAPGLRRALSADALPVIFDEGEPDTLTDRQRMQGILGLVRQASTESEAVIMQAGVGDAVAAYCVRTMVCLQSINTTAYSQADLGRTEILPLRDTYRDDDVPFRDLVAVTRENLPDEFGARLFARSVSLLPVILENIKTFESAIAAIPGQTQRRADQIGTLLAGAYSLHSDKLVTPAAAAQYAAEDGWLNAETPPPEMRDENQLAAHIMSRKIRIGAREYTVARLIEMASGIADDGQLSVMEAIEPLLAMGIKLVHHNGRDGLAISTSHPNMRQALSGTPWETSWGRALTRIAGAVQSSDMPAMRFGPHLVSRCVWIPLGGGEAGRRW